MYGFNPKPLELPKASGYESNMLSYSAAHVQTPSTMLSITPLTSRNLAGINNGLCDSSKGEPETT